MKIFDPVKNWIISSMILSLIMCFVTVELDFNLE